MKIVNKKPDQLSKREIYLQSLEALRKEYRVKFKVKENDTELKHLVGETVWSNPPVPDNCLDALDLFKKYYAEEHFRYQKFEFESYFELDNDEAVRLELESINAFINAIDKNKYLKAFKSPDFDNEQEEYLRLTGGYYKTHLMTWEQHGNNTIAARIYGRFILFREYLLKYYFTPQQVELNKVFISKGHYLICIHLLKRYSIIDESNNCILSERGHGILHAIISGFYKCNPTILSKPYAMNQLKQIFSKFLDRSIGDIKRDSVLYKQYHLEVNAEIRKALSALTK